MKNNWKIFSFLFGICLILFGTAITVKAEELPTTQAGEKVVIKDFEILSVPITDYYRFEPLDIYDGFLNYDEMVMTIHTKGVEYKLSYTVGGVPYEVTDKMEESYSCESGISVHMPEIVGFYDGPRIYVYWKNYSTKNVDGEEHYFIDMKNNAICFKWGDIVKEVPVKFNQPSPVKEITVLENPLKDGVYVYQYMGSDIDYSGLKIKITYKDGRDDDIVEFEDMISYPHISEYSIFVNQDAECDGILGVDVKNIDFSVSYMGVNKIFKVPLKKNPVKKIEVIKKPKKMLYKIKFDPADLYGATLKITYLNNKSQTINIKSHKTTIPVDNNYNESLQTVYIGGNRLIVDYMGERLTINTTTNISALKNAKKISTGKKNTVTLKKNNMLDSFVFTPEKTGVYDIEYVTKKVQKGVKKVVMNDHMWYVLDENGKIIQENDDYTGINEKGELGLKKGVKYYYCVFTADNETDDMDITANIVYKGALKSQKITTTDIRKVYGNSDFTIEAKSSSGNKLSYTSSNKNVVTVSKSGKVKITGAGTAYITVKAEAGGVYNTATKKIKVTIQKGNANLKVPVTKYRKNRASKSFRINATADATVKYKSSNTKIVTVTGKGLVSIKGAGRAEIIVTAEDKNHKKVSRKVTVNVA